MNNETALLRRFDIKRTRSWIGKKALYYPSALTKREAIAVGDMLKIDSGPIGDKKPFVYVFKCDKHGNVWGDSRYMVFVDDLAKG